MRHCLQMIIGVFILPSSAHIHGENPAVALMIKLPGHISPPRLHGLLWLFFFGPWQSPFVYPLGTENLLGCISALETVMKASHFHLMVVWLGYRLCQRGHSRLSYKMAVVSPAITGTSQHVSKSKCGRKCPAPEKTCSSSYQRGQRPKHGS